MSTLLIRSTKKQGFAQAAKVVMLDSAERLAAWADQMNDALGWKKYGTVAPEPVDASAINDGVVEAVDHYEELLRS